MSNKVKKKRAAGAGRKPTGRTGIFLRLLPATCQAIRAAKTTPAGAIVDQWADFARLPLPAIIEGCNKTLTKIASSTCEHGKPADSCPACYLNSR